MARHPENESEFSLVASTEIPVLDFIDSPEWRAQLFEINRLRFEISLLSRLLTATRAFFSVHNSLFWQVTDVTEFINESTPQELQQELFKVAQDLLLEALSPQLKNSEDTLMVWVGAEIMKPLVKERINKETLVEEENSWFISIITHAILRRKLKTHEQPPVGMAPVSFALREGQWQAEINVTMTPQETDLGLEQKERHTLVFYLNSEVIAKRKQNTERELRSKLTTILQKIKKNDLIDTLTGGHTHYVTRKKELWNYIFSIEQLLFFDEANPHDTQLKHEYQGKWLSLTTLLDRLHDHYGYSQLENLKNYFVEIGLQRQKIIAELQTHTVAQTNLVNGDEVEKCFQESGKMVCARFFTDYFQIALKANEGSEATILTIPFDKAEQMLAETEGQRTKLLEWHTVIRDIFEHSQLVS